MNAEKHPGNCDEKQSYFRQRPVCSQRVLAYTEILIVLRLGSLLDVKRLRFTDASYACSAIRHFFSQSDNQPLIYSEQKSSTICLTK